MMKLISLCIFLLFSGIHYGQPQIKFDSTTYRLRSLRVGIPVVLKIPFQNIGNQPLIITGANGTGPPSVEKPLDPVRPNEKGYINVSLFTSAIGKSRQPIFITTNRNDSATVIDIQLEVVGTNGERRISGMVKDTAGQAIPGASIRLLNSSVGTSASFTGYYSLLARPTDTIVCSAVSFFEQSVSAAAEELDIVLLPRPHLEVEFWHPGIKRRTEQSPISVVTVKELEKSVNPKYYFSKYAKQNTFILYLDTAFTLNETDSLFQRTYHVYYSWGANADFARKFNRLTIKHLNKMFQRDWQNAVRKEVIGLKVRGR
ncbi:MAG: DUF1573 domain-containing protein [Bacteroidetes bacterium]|nr:DUF1573 domain-containing protein [Bacteroidota bacterium]